MATLSEVMAGLDGIGHAARRGDVSAVNAAIVEGKTLGLTDEQIRDAVAWGAKTAPLSGPRLDTGEVKF